jgi:DNA invertase Pin-like site-specific DNA recombinase
MSNGRTKVVGYIRVSTQVQADEGVSLSAQRTKIEAYCIAMDLDLVGIVEDAGISAKTLDRAGLRSALAMLESGKAQAMLVTKLDRLTRSVRDLGDLIERFFTKYSLLSMSDQIDTRSASGRLMLNLLTSVAQWERETTGERTRDALAHKRANGEFTGGNVPYGFSVENGLLVQNEAEVELLRIVREYAASGLSLNGICAELARVGITSRKGKGFAPAQIKRMLAA